MENIKAFEPEDLAPFLCHPLDLGACIFCLRCLPKSDAQAPVDLAEQPEESSQHDHLDHKDPTEGDSQICKDPLAEGATLGIGLIGFSCSICLLQHRDECSNHHLLAELVRSAHHIHVVLLLLADLLMSANLQHGPQLVESLDRQGFGAKVSRVVTARHSMQREQLSLQCLLNP